MKQPKIKFGDTDQGKYNANQNVSSTGHESYSDNRTWLCPNDDTVNTGDTCIICGHPRPGNRNRKNFPMWIALFAVLLLGFLFGQLVSPKQPGASVAEDSATASAAKSSAEQHTHVWKDATYNSPKICTVCGKTEGSKKTPSSRLHLADIVVHASATSIMPENGKYCYTPENLYDQNSLTYWVEGTDGAGIGEYATLYFDGTYAIKEFTILIGSHYQKDSTYFEKHNRPSAIMLYFSDGSSEYIQLDDTRDYQTIIFSEYHYADYVEIIIEEVYSGIDWNETIIAEVDFAAYIP